MLNLWLAIKRRLQVGRFSVVVADKCDSHWTDVECPNPSVIATFHRGQFGHKVRFEFCNACYVRRKEWEASDESSLMAIFFNESNVKEVDLDFNPKAK